MLFNSQECVKRDLNLQKNTLKRYKEQLKKLPKGSLYASERNGVKYYTKVTNFRGKKRSVYLGKETNPQVQLLQKKYYLRKAIQAMESNISLMEKFLNGYQSIDPPMFCRNSFRRHIKVCHSLALIQRGYLTWIDGEVSFT